MKKLSIYLSGLLLLAASTACTKDALNDVDANLHNTVPKELNAVLNISEDNSGNVQITPMAEGVLEFVVDPGHGEDGAVTLKPGESLHHSYPEGNYTIDIQAKSITGAIQASTHNLDMVYRAPENISISASQDAYNLTISATADFANGFLVFFGDDPNEEGTPLSVGETLPAHTYASAGLYQVRVIALSGGAATSEEVIEVQIYDPYGLPITFEDLNQNYAHGGTFGGVDTAIVDNPAPGGINTSAKVWQYTKNTAAATWSGTWTPLQTPLDLSQGKKIKIWVYANEVGKEINLELEWAVDNVVENGVAVLKVANTVANEWEELTFDYSTIAALPDDVKFTQYVFRYNDSAEGTGEVIYIDNIHQTN
ncbi:hypothetical protein E7Z59_04240 [Robertkochia marina]|uniref:PKD domain-containing protein n=1 Tax=Robertkochia marina TaxID=1227945 RepID=A0A4S3M437_9FLAO|nr:hypothetical protein [Robertkochia marina]THD69545.1 hypothetical protein E7Z59_04240 [Robertkochia marina]TRZ47197.1 hypothetical protein D3A96_00330 [Robertkochia marina]